MKYFFLVLGCFFYCNYTTSQDQILKLWSEKVPNQTFSDTQEIVKQGQGMHVRNVQNPEIWVYKPSYDIANGKAVLIMPGGGYYHMVFEKEGTDMAKWLNAHGIAGIVLKYRLPHTKNLIVGHIAPLQDAQRAMQFIRQYASDWNIHPDEIGVMGFSAGGHLASTLATQFLRDLDSPKDSIAKNSARPDFACLVYPVISMMEGIGHEGSKKNLLGESASKTLVNQYSSEKQVTADTPPTFLVHTTDDSVVSVLNSVRFYEALITHGIEAEMHLFAQGKHGFALGLNDSHLATWKTLFLEWLDRLLSHKEKTDE